MAVVLPSEQANVPLSLAQAEAIFASLWRASVPTTLSSGGILTIPGSGRYKVLPFSGNAQSVTSIVLTGENIEGTLIELRPNTASHTITILHAGNYHLEQGVNIALSTIWSTVWLRHHGSGIWAQAFPLLYVP